MPAVLTFAPIRGATEDEQQCYEALEFQPTCPVRGTTAGAAAPCMPWTYFNPRAPYGARPSWTACGTTTRTNFNPRAPYGARQERVAAHARSIRFQSTCPVRGTTSFGTPAPGTTADFNPRAPYGARPLRLGVAVKAEVISIHVPRTGHDVTQPWDLTITFLFQSTCPVRGTTAKMHK